MSQKRVLFFLILLVAISLSFYFLLIQRQDDLDEYAKKLQDLIDTKSIAENMRHFAIRPHRAGTNENHAVGERIIQELRSSGSHVWTEDYHVELPQRGNGLLKLTFPVQQEIDYSEKSFQEDKYTDIASVEQPFFAYIPDSDIEGDVIYANFGDRQDYEFLRNQGIQTAGKIALLRTQGSCRGMKQMVAEEEGLAGLLLYPDPRDQGFKKVAYPKGPGIHPWVAQRGSMLKFFVYPGNPDLQVADNRENTLPTVPALPITSEAAKMILQKLGGSSNKDWKGWLDTAYNTGPGPARVRIQYQSKRQKLKIRNIFATIGGTNKVDPVLMISSHYDAWVYGASDPGSGSAAVLEAAKALLALEKKGWKPKRDIVFAFWDAEEYGMIGSTQWVFNHLQQSRSRIGNLVYVDSARGPMFTANVLPGLRALLDQVLTRFSDPTTGKLIRDFHIAHEMPGFSDDTIPFSNFAGVPVAQLNYGPYYTMYHSIYDNLEWMERFGDPGYAYVSSLARIIALYSIALTKEDRLPFRFSEFASHYESELNKIQLENIEEPEQKAQFKETMRILKDVGTIGAQIEIADLRDISAGKRKKINELLLEALLCFTEPPGRTSMPFRLRNVVVGPSIENECAGIGLPGIRRALHANQESRLEEELNRLKKAFSRCRDHLQKAASMIESHG